MAAQTLPNGWAAHLAPPLFSWYDVGATTIVLVIAGALLAGMFMFIRLASDDSTERDSICPSCGLQLL